MLIPSPQAILFDLDGTLVDTAPDLAAATNALRAHHGLAALPFQVTLFLWALRASSPEGPLWWCWPRRAIKVHCPQAAWLLLRVGFGLVLLPG